MTDSFYFDNTVGVVTLRCRALDSAGFGRHCFTTRIGGISTGHLAYTNLSFSREDKNTVYENYRRVFDAVGIKPTAVLSNQQHTDIVAQVTEPESSENFTPVETADAGTGLRFFVSRTAADGLVTDRSGICLVTFVADCVPIIIADPVRRAAACVHSGWRSTALGIGDAAVRKMQACFGSRPEDLIAAVGPCIGPCCYEVGSDVYDAFAARSELMRGFFAPAHGGKYMLDMGAANRFVLISAGLRPENIHVSGQCTCHNSELYYSHRATKGKRGNMAAMIQI